MKFKQLSMVGMAISALFAIASPASAWITEENGERHCYRAEYGNYDPQTRAVYQRYCDEWRLQVEALDELTQRHKDFDDVKFYQNRAFIESRSTGTSNNPLVGTNQDPMSSQYRLRIDSFLDAPGQAAMNAYLREAGYLQARHGISVAVPSDLTGAEVTRQAFERYAIVSDRSRATANHPVFRWALGSFLVGNGPYGYDQAPGMLDASPINGMTMVEFVLPIRAYMREVHEVALRQCTFDAEKTQVCPTATAIFEKEYRSWKMTSGSNSVLQSMHYDNLRGNSTNVQMAPAGGNSIIPQFQGMTRNPGAYTR